MIDKHANAWPAEDVDIVIPPAREQSDQLLPVCSFLLGLLVLQVASPHVE